MLGIELVQVKGASSATRVVTIRLDHWWAALDCLV